MNWIYFTAGVVLILFSVGVLVDRGGNSEHENYMIALVHVGNAICGIGLIVAGYVLYLMSGG